MGKFFLRLFVLLLITIVSSTIYLSYFGINTDKFDDLIKTKANEVNRHVKLEFQKTKIHLNPKELNLIVRLQNPKILIRGNEINLSKLDLFLSLKSFFSSDFLLKRTEVAFVGNDIKDLTKITDIFLPKLINKQLNKIFDKGNLEGKFVIPFETDGSLGKNYGFSGKVSDASINLAKQFNIRNLTAEINNLNDFLKPYRLHFAPDVSTSSRANIGGMIGNNSAGVHSILYGKTVDHILELSVVLSTGEKLLFKTVDAQQLAQKCNRFHPTEKHTPIAHLHL